MRGWKDSDDVIWNESPVTAFFDDVLRFGVGVRTSVGHGGAIAPAEAEVETSLDAVK